ncbi:MAG: glycosyltransferase family A protein [Propionibacteriaceae bacterium]|nr:glycosyltransferase family 2 protein [Micropruina sp.]
MQGSVIVPSRGGRARLPRLLAALEAQTLTDFEVIVVCDGDIDDSAGLIDSWSDRLDVHSVVFPENRGRPAALNAGFAQAAGRVLIRCDDDLDPQPDFVANHVAHHSGEPVGIVGICHDVFGDTAYARAYGRDADERTVAFWRTLPPEDTWRCWSANVSVTRETFDAIGSYDDRYRRYGWEDVDWGYRLHLAGIPVIVAEDVTCGHFGPAASIRDRAEKAFLSGASEFAFTSKHGVNERHGAGPTSSWNVLVRCSANIMSSEAAVIRWAGVADRILAFVPKPIGTKLAALTVEGAGRSGHRRSMEQTDAAPSRVTDSR